MCYFNAGEIISYYTFTVTSIKMWTHLHRLSFGQHDVSLVHQRLKIHSVEEKNMIKAFLLKYILIAGVNNLHNKSQTILITLYHSVSPFIWKPLFPAQLLGSQS